VGEKDSQESPSLPNPSRFLKLDPPNRQRRNDGQALFDFSSIIAPVQQKQPKAGPAANGPKAEASAFNQHHRSQTSRSALNSSQTKRSKQNLDVPPVQRRPPSFIVSKVRSLIVRRKDEDHQGV
jgi:hypothetical protein